MLSETEKDALVKRFKKLDMSTLSNLVGERIIRIVKKSIPNFTEKALAEVLVERLDTEILTKKNVRMAFIESLGPEEAEAAVKKLSLGGKGDHWDILRIYFGNWTQSKSVQFIEVFSFSNKCLLPLASPKPLSSEVISPTYKEALESKGQLHPYQLTIKNQVNKQLSFSGQRELIVQMPTGAGKTFTMLESLVDLLRSHIDPIIVVWLVNSNELARQSMESFTQLWKQKGDRSIAVYKFFDALKPTEFINNRGIVFGSFSTVNAVIKNQEHKSATFLVELAKRTHTLVIDEAHSSPANTYSGCISFFYHHGLKKIVGLTATPGREGATELNALVEIYQRNIIQIKDQHGAKVNNVVSYLQEREYLAKLKTDFLETSSTVSTQNEDKICEELAKDRSRNAKIIDKIEDAISNNLSTLVFACTLPHVFALYILCKQKGISSEFIVGETPPSKRMEILKRFKNRENLVLINLDILETGVDIPSLDHVFITRPIGSGISYSQIIGRALRGPKNGGKKLNLITTLVDNIDLHSNEQMMFKSYWESWGI